jgi:hypothetical protein
MTELKSEINLQDKNDSEKTEAELESDLKKAKDVYENKKKLYEDKKLLKFKEKLPSNNKKLRMNPYSEQNYQKHTTAIKNDIKKMELKIQKYTKTIETINILLVKSEIDGQNVAEYISQNNVLIDAMVEILCTMNNADILANPKICRWIDARKGTIEFDQSGGISDDTRGPKKNLASTAVSRKSFTFLLLSKFKLTDDIKELIDKICPLAMDIKYLEKESEKMNLTEDQYRMQQWDEFEKLGKSFLALLESKL